MKAGASARLARPRRASAVTLGGPRPLRARRQFPGSPRRVRGHRTAAEAQP